MYIESALIKIAVIPAYEPDENLIDVASEAAASGFEVVVVDDGSTGGNAVKAGKVPAEQYRRIFEDAKRFAHVISYSENRGKGYAMKEAFAYIRDKYKYEPGYAVVVIDSDGQHRVTDAVRLVEYAAAHSGTLVLGSRRQSRSSPLRSRIGNCVTRRIFRMISGVGVYDTQTGMRAFSKELTERMLEISGDRYEYEMNTLMEFAQKGVPMAELPIETIYIDGNSGSHFDAFADSVRIYKEILKFALSGFISFLIDYGIFGCIVGLFGTTPEITVFANVFARFFSALANYNINRNLVFSANVSDSYTGESKKGISPLKKYVLLAAGVLFLNTSVIYILTAIAGINPLLAKIVTEVIVFFLNFAIQKRYVFANEVKENRKEKNGTKNASDNAEDDIKVLGYGQYRTV